MSRRPLVLYVCCGEITSLRFLIWEGIATFLPLKDAIALSETSKLMNEATRSRIWNTPVFKRRMTWENLSTLSHLPIRELSTSMLRTSHDRLSSTREMIETWKSITEQFNLETLHIDIFHSFKHGLLKAHLVNSLPVQVVIHTTISSTACPSFDDYDYCDHDYEFFEDKHFSKFIDFLDYRQTSLLY